MAYLDTTARIRRTIINDLDLLPAENYRKSRMQAVAEFKVGDAFCSDEAGEMRRYERIASAPGYQDLGDTAAPASRQFVDRSLAERAPKAETSAIESAPVAATAESAYGVVLGNGPARQIAMTVRGATTAGTPGTGADANSSYRNAIELTPDYLCMNNQSGWNNGPGSNSGRTGIYATRRKLVHDGQGDHVAFNASVRIRSKYVGATHWLASPAGVILNGTVVGEADGAYLNPLEFLLKDSTGSTAAFTASTTAGSEILSNVAGTLRVGDAITGPGIPSGAFIATVAGATATMVRYSNYIEVPAKAGATANLVNLTRVISFSVACAGAVFNAERNRNAEPSARFGGTGIGEPWWIIRAQPRGTCPVDNIVSAIGKAHVGIDFSMPYLKFVNDAAIAVKAGMRRYLNATGFAQDDATTFVRDNTRMTGGYADYDFYDPTTLQYKVVIGGVEALKVSNARITAPAIACGAVALDGTLNKLFVNGLTIVGARKTGWGPWTGTANRAAKATYTAPAPVIYNAGAALTFSSTYQKSEHDSMATRLAAIEAALAALVAQAGPNNVATQDVSQTMKAALDDLSIRGGSHGIFGE